MSHNSYWINSADTRWSVGGHLVTDVLGYISVSIFLVAQRGCSFGNIWTFNNDEYLYIVNFYAMTPYSLVGDYKGFGTTCSLHLQL